jgi:hypothetical protein
MIKNQDVIADILTMLENLPNTKTPLTLSAFPKDRAHEYSHNMAYLIEDRLVVGKMMNVFGEGPTDFIVHRLTSAGHKLLDSIRSGQIKAR